MGQHFGSGRNKGVCCTDNDGLAVDTSPSFPHRETVRFSCEQIRRYAQPQHSGVECASEMVETAAGAILGSEAAVTDMHLKRAIDLRG
jgi:hypothetical protein